MAASILVILWIVWIVLTNKSEEVRFNEDQFEATGTMEASGEALTGDQYTEAASNSSYILSVNPSNQAYKLQAVHSDNVWSSIPGFSAEEQKQAGLLKNASSAFVMEFTIDGVEKVTLLPNNEQGEIQSVRINNGVRISYYYPRIQIGFALEYILNEDGFTIRIPEQSIKEDGKASLVSIQPSPYFNSARSNDPGYIFYPDGVGAKMNFDQSRIKNSNAYRKVIYGQDDTIVDVSATKQESIYLPITGMVKENQGFLAIIEQGDSEAYLQVQAPGALNTPFYRTSFEMTYRNVTFVKAGEFRSIRQIEKTRVQGDREIRYVLFEGKGLSYVTIAKHYASMLEAATEGQSSKSEPSLYARLLMGVEGEEGTFKTLYPMTSFNQASELVKLFKQEAIFPLSIGLAGWEQKGYYGSQPRRFPAAAELGGSNGLKGFLADAKESNVPVHLVDNPLVSFNKRYIEVNSEVSRNPLGGVVSLHPLYSDGSARIDIHWYLLNSSRSVAYTSNNFIEKAGNYGIKNVDYEMVGSLLYTDYSHDHGKRRFGMMRDMKELLSLTNEHKLAAGVAGGNQYVLEQVSRIMAFPQQSSFHYLIDETIPLYPIVTKNLVSLFGSPINNTDNPTASWLRSAEYGINPAYELTYEPSTNLQYTFYNRLFSSEYTRWLDSMKQSIRVVNEITKPLMNVNWQDHKLLQEGLYESIYEDGTIVRVNYNSFPLTWESSEIKAEDFIVIRGGVKP